MSAVTTLIVILLCVVVIIGLKREDRNARQSRYEKQLPLGSLDSTAPPLPAPLPKQIKKKK